MIKKCLLCGKEFEAKNPNKKFCCTYCCERYRYIKKKEQTSILKTCPVCGKQFISKLEKTIFCSKSCSGKNNYKNSKEKYKQSMVMKYGVDHPMKSVLIKEKSKQTCLKKYGVEYALQTDLIKEKSKQTCLKKYGVEYTFQVDSIREKGKETLYKKYGVTVPIYSEDIKNKITHTILEKYGVDNVFKNRNIKEKIKNTCLQKYGKTTYLLTDNCPTPQTISKQNRKRGNFIREVTGLEVEYEFRGIEGYSYDLKVGKFLIEIDPTVTHNSSKGFLKHRKPIPKLYHQKKSLAAEQAGYHCIHLFDWDNNEQVKNWLIGLLTKRKNLHNGKIMKVDGKEAEKFYDANHLQGKCSATVHYGIYVKGELINCMSFTCFKGEWTLVRFASKMGFRIYQGAGRLFRTFIREYNPDYVVSFSDITKHSGGLYNALGFTVEQINTPSYWWVGHGQVYRRRDCQKQNMHRIEGFDPNYKYLDHKDDLFWKQSEKELMESHGYVIVYDAGMRKHVWRK